MIIKENSRASLASWIENYTEKIQPKFSSHLFSHSEKSVTNIKETEVTYDATAEVLTVLYVGAKGTRY